MTRKLAFILIILSFYSCSNLKNKMVIAHRGASAYLPEHTLEGAVMAHTWGVDYIEPDVVMTKDNHLVVLHDIHLDTTTNVKKRYPKKMRSDKRFYAIDFTLKEIKKLKVHERYNLKTKKAKYRNRFNSLNQSFSVPTFKEFSNLIKDLNKSRKKKIGIYVEFKSPEFHLKNRKDITKRLVKELRELNLLASDTPVIIQSFYPPSLVRLKNEFNITLPLVQLIAHDSWGESTANYKKMLTKEGIAKISSYAQGVGPWLPLLLDNSNNKRPKANKIMAMLKKENLAVHPFTARADDLPVFAKSYDELLDIVFKTLKVDGIFTDQGDLALKYLSRNQ